MKRFSLLFALSAIALSPLSVHAEYDLALAERLSGRITLQVEQHGEAWYIRPSDGLRYYMKDGATAYQMMREFSLGITDADLALIPSVADTAAMNAADSACEENELANRLKGEILLQVEQHGEAWYVDPVKCRAIYMEDGDAAYEIMRYLGLGILDADLAKIQEGVAPEVEVVEEPEPETPVEPEESIPTETLPEYSYSGHSNGFTDRFELQSGIAFITMTHDGDSFLTVDLLNDDTGTTEEQYLAFELGDYQGRKLVQIHSAGTYLLNVEADGAWTIDITQNIPPTSPTSLPDTVQGGNEIYRAFDLSVAYKNDDVIGPFFLDAGIHTFTMSHLGDSFFDVGLIDAHGEQVEWLAFELGNVSEMGQAISVSVPGDYYLTVDGEEWWSITID